MAAKITDGSAWLLHDAPDDARTNADDLRQDPWAGGNGPDPGAPPPASRRGS